MKVKEKEKEKKENKERKVKKKKKKKEKKGGEVFPPVVMNTNILDRICISYQHGATGRKTPLSNTRQRKNHKRSIIYKKFS